MNSTNTIGYTSETPKHFLVDSGALYKNYGLATEELIGATSGSNEFDVKIKTIDKKINGLKGKQKGLTLVTEVEVTLKANLLEATSDILKMLLLGEVDTTSDSDYDIVTGKDYIADSDYIDNVALVGKVSGSGKPIIIIIKNVLVLDGLSIKMEDDKDNTLPVTFTAFSDPLTPSEKSYEIRYPKDGTGFVFDLAEQPYVDNGKVLLTFTDTVAAIVPYSGFAVTVAGSNDVITGATRGVNKLNTVLLTLTTQPTGGQAVTVAYTKPEVDGDRVKSASGVALDTFAVVSVINN